MARVVLVLSTAQTWIKVIEMKYIVEIPWHGVKKGQIVELKKLHPSLKSNVRPVELDSEESASLSHSDLEGMISEAEALAAKIIEEANAEAEKIIMQAKEEAGKLTPATPEATADKKAPAKK